MVLICQFSRIDGAGLMNAIEATFRNRSETPPSRLVSPPDDWKLGYARMATQVNLDPDLAIGYAAACRFLDPALAHETVDLIWNPESQTWVRDQSDQMAPFG